MGTSSIVLRSKNKEPLNRLAIALLDQMPDYIGSLEGFELQGSATSVLGDGTEGAVTISLVAARFDSVEAIDVQQVAHAIEIAEANGFDLKIEGPDTFLRALNQHISQRTDG